MFSTIIIFIIILGTLVLVHELGHFVAARRNGITAEEFGIGFPPRLVGTFKTKQGKRKWVFGGKEIEKEIIHEDSTVYSINLIPIGGFVRIKGEDGTDKKDPDSFASRSIWTRFKVLSAGVMMNFVLGIFLLTFAFWIGLPEVVDNESQAVNGKVQILEVMPQSPAQQAGITPGDEIVSVTVGDQTTPITTTAQFQQITKDHAGGEITIKVVPIGTLIQKDISVKLRQVSEDQGALGVSLAKTAFVRHPFFESFWLAIKTTFSLIMTIIVFLKDLIVKLFTSQPISADVAGPVGIAVLTGQVAKLGIAYLLQFAAMLSINLGVINFFPFPALDGGRVLFLLIEKIKGSPVSQKIEGVIHTTGFVLLLGLMVMVTVRDFINFDIVEKIKGIFY